MILLLITYPLFGPFGTTNGKIIPTPPQKAVNIMNGIADAPILIAFCRKIKQF